MAITVSFTDASSPGPSGPITAWDWNFGDGNTSSTQNPIHNYAAAGSYTVSLRVTGSGSDGTASTSRTIFITDPSLLNASFTDTISSLAVTFTDTATPGPSGPITGWSWDFGDGGTSTAQNPSHTYATSGSYTVRLTVTGTAPDGTDSATTTLTVSSGGGGGTGYRPYTSASALNKAIPSPAPIHPDSATMLSSANNWIVSGSFAAWLGPRYRYHYYRGNTSGLPATTIYVNWSSGTGYSCGAGGSFTFPCPSWLAADVGPTSQAGDSIVTIVDSSTGDVWEMYRVTPPGYASRNVSCSTSRWNCLGYRHWAGDTVTGTGYTLPSGIVMAAHLHSPGGLLVPEDFADCFSGSDPGTVIPHALRMNTFCGSNGTTHPKFVAPAFSGDGHQSAGIPHGARVQLDPAINVATWPSVNTKTEPWRSGLKKLLRTMQVYGIIPVDSTSAPGTGGIDCCSPGSVAHGGTTYASAYKFPWDAAGYGWSYNNGVPADLMSHFRVIDWTRWTGV